MNGSYASGASIATVSEEVSPARVERHATFKSNRTSRSVQVLEEPVLPPEYSGSEVLEVFRLADVPTVDDLSKVLSDRGIDISTWGQGNTKDVSKLWKEIVGQEAGLEVWRKSNGELAPMRVTHVLRGKVSSPENYARGIFLLNTWQQYGDGRKRTRNGLLSEKLTTDEIPLVDHLHEVCTRAVVEEEMGVVVDAAVRVQPDSIMEYDPQYRCPLTVIAEEFVEHTVEIEISKSYPGLVTVYHLYTVDILVSGLPTTDFNTLEFDHEDKDGKRPLKYVHAWIWEQWGTIQRYLLQGSELKERKTKGDFKTPYELEEWLRQFDIDLDAWGKDGWKSIAALHAEVEREETELEHWARHDSVPLLMRVVHVIQLKVTSSDLRQSRKFLFQVWQQTRDGVTRHVNRFMARKLSTSQLPFDLERFTKAATQAVQDQLSHLVDIHIRLSPHKLPDRIYGEHPHVTVKQVDFSDHRNDLEDSPSFKGMVTMYHLYTVEVECEGLPVADFASIVHQNNNVLAFGWKWVTWQQTLDILHTRSRMMENKDKDERDKLQVRRKDGARALEKLTEAIGRLKASSSTGDAQVEEVSRIAAQLEARLSGVLSASAEDGTSITPRSNLLPPAMLSNLADRKLVSDSFLNEAMVASQRRHSAMNGFGNHRMPGVAAKSLMDSISDDDAGLEAVDEDSLAKPERQASPHSCGSALYSFVFSGCARAPEESSIEIFKS